MNKFKLKDSHLKLIQIITYYLSFLVCIFYIIYIFSNLGNSEIDFYFNSDILYFPTLFEDIFKNSYSLKGWTLPGSPNFFPDMFLYFLLMFIFNDVVIASFVFSIIQFSIILLAINLIINALHNKKKYIINSIVNLSLSLFLFVDIFANDFIFTFYILSNTYHLGVFTVFLFSLFIIIKFFQQNRNYWLIILLVISTLAVFSDRLYIILYSIPICSLILFINKDNYKIISKLLIVNIISLIVGLLAFRIFKNSGIVLIAGNYHILNFAGVVSSINIFVNQMLGYLFAFDIRSLIIILSFFSLISLLIFLLGSFFKTVKEKGKISKEKIIYIYFLIITITSVLIISTPIINGNYLDHSSIRYSIFGFYILIFNLFPLFIFGFRKIRVQVISKIAGYIFLIVILLIFVFHISKFKPDTFKKYLTYYPECAECLDEYVADNGYSYGIATYWIAKVATMFSKTDTRVYTVYDDSMYPYYHVSNYNWYWKNNGKYSDPLYNFAIVSENQDMSVILKNIGNPKCVIECGKYIILEFDTFSYDRTTKAPYFINQHAINDSLTFFTDFESEILIYENNLKLDSVFSYSGKYSNVVNSNSEYSYTHSLKFNEISANEVTKVKLSAWTYANNLLTEAKFVFSIEDDNGFILYKTINLTDNSESTGEWINITGIYILPEIKDKDAIIKAYIWNNDEFPVFVDDISLIFF